VGLEALWIVAITLQKFAELESESSKTEITWQLVSCRCILWKQRACI